VAALVATMLELIAIAFAEETIAAQAAQEVDRTVEELEIDPDAIAVIICERSGSCQLMARRRPASTGAWGTFWGQLLELVMEESPRTGGERGFLGEVRKRLTPGSSVLFIVGTRAQGQRAIDAVTQYGGLPLSCPLGQVGITEPHHSVRGSGTQ
jgi:uncharacterized membrane protein